jgi:hypothetical protein
LEDWIFCSHDGLDPEAVAKALAAASGNVRGASTISPQTAPNRPGCAKGLKFYRNIAKWGRTASGRKPPSKPISKKPMA